MDKLVIKYKKVKGLYFERQSQVEQLQNTLANQRLSQSRTSLDDGGYATRFTRLDGAIKEVAFSIRKDWKTIPRWLTPYVNLDAQKAGSKEMTPVGRAFISRWIYDEIFGKCFHPGLDRELSSALKRIEQNIRALSSTLTNQEEADALTSKVIQWKLTTFDGLCDRLASRDSQDAKAQFARISVANLTGQLLQHLQEPAPEGIEGSATSIVELAVDIASHLPRESRDICITYPLPGESIQPSGMKVEPPLPALENPGSDESEEPSAKNDAKDGEGDKSESGNKLSKNSKADSKGKSGGLMPSGSSSGRKGSVPTGSQGQGTQESGAVEKEGSGVVRFAGFVGVEVKGRQWLVNAPVWLIS